ncbi:L-fuculokinase [uncultured Robinsoniella sp.]|uniref:FGGY-family carbohydrate kinase n=1 Tax=uncultured Robinsoniella sp. TaxID=904190 RepID=UPI00374E8382
MIIGIDMGTTHIKSVLFDHAGSVIGMDKEKTPLHKDLWGDIYKPDVIWGIVKNQIAGLAATAKGQVQGISITGMAEAGLIVNRRTGMEETDILPWFDKRTVGLVGQMTEEEDLNFMSTGLRGSFKYGIYKFIWLLENGNILREDAVWLSMCDYIAWKLTGEFVTDPSFAARTYVYDIRQGCWDADRIKGYHLETNNFPRVLPSGEGIYICNPEIRQLLECGSGNRVRAAVAGHDHVCAAFALLQNREEDICNSLGTAETYIGILKDTKKKNQGAGQSGRLQGSEKEELFQQDSGFIYGPFVDGGYFWMGNIPSAGQSVEWFRKTVQKEEITYKEMNDLLESMPEDPTGILYYPYLTGVGTPLFKADAGANFIGLKMEHTYGHILKGIMEGIQYQAAWILELLYQSHGIKPGIVRCAGGAANSRGWMQIKADVLGKRIQVPLVTEATVLGAAALYIKKNQGSEACRLFLEAPLKTGDCYDPDGDRKMKYNRLWSEKYMPLAEVISGHALSWRERVLQVIL